MHKLIWYGENRKINLLSECAGGAVLLCTEEGGVLVIMGLAEVWLGKR
jgi:hypothetical protein